jgi:N6-L-threonylcarbamoyladenine synthase
VALLREGRQVLASLISSQAALHSRYGGVVPEVACRRHLEVLHPLLAEALNQAGVELREVEAVAVTHGPGLVGALLLGVAAAKALAALLEVPLIGVNHLEGHICSVFLEYPELAPPLVSLVVSGGHTTLVLMPRPGVYQVLGQTRDDAAGEAFDKVAKACGLGYPGGPVVDRMARQGDPQAIPFPRPMLDREGYEFSFAGLKTAVLNYLASAPEVSLPDLCASFQEAVVDVLVTKTMAAARQFSIDRVCLVGGVAANSRLRGRLGQACHAEGRELFVPSAHLCTDNAAMIARAGWELARLGLRSPLTLDAVPGLPLVSRVPA